MPISYNICDKCKTPLVLRSDDNKFNIYKRIKNYKRT